MKPYRLFALPSLWSGAARLVDIGGVFDQYNYSASDAEADNRAIMSDWGYVGRDLRSGMHQILAALGSRGI